MRGAKRKHVQIRFSGSEDGCVKPETTQSSLMWIDAWGLVAEFASQVKNYSDKKKLNALLIMFKWRPMCARSPAISRTRLRKNGKKGAYFRVNIN